MSRSSPHRLARALLAFLALTSVGCSENFGTPPDPNAPRITVSEQGFAGPIEPFREPRLLRGNSQLLYLAMDQRGSYRVRPGDAHWLPGPERLGFREARHLATDRSARLWVASDGVNLLASVDGGEIFDTLSSPSAVSPVEFLAALPPSELHPAGAWFAVVGIAAYLRPIGAAAWSAVELPATPDTYLAFDADAQGRALLGVQSTSGYALWGSEDGARSFQVADTLTSAPLAVALFGEGRQAVVHFNGLRVDAEELPGLPSADIDAAALRGDASGFELLAHHGGELWWGRGPQGPWSARGAEALVRTDAGLVASAGGGFALAGDRSLLQLAGGMITSIPFAGAHLDMGAVAVDPRSPGSVELAGGPRGEVWSGPAVGPWESLGIPGQPSVSALLPDPFSSDGTFSSGFGVQYRAAGSTQWEDRSDGQSSYLCDLFFGGPVVVHTLAARPGSVQELWLGAINGDGPYRSLDAGRSWLAVHDGLGAIGSCLEESGLQGISQARAFAFRGSDVYLGGFKGGVWQLEESPLRWAQRNTGLPDVFGDAVDSCCFDPLEREVDVRDLVVLQDGTLLAATGWGIYRREPGAQRWHLSSTGLSNFDVYRLVPLPTDSDFVLAGCSGKVDAPRWLFLSRDAGQSWETIDTELQAREVKYLVWSDPARLEALAVLEWSGAWRLRLKP